MNPHNATSAITNLVSFINKDDEYQQSYEYQQIMANGKKGHSEEDGLSTAMRLLMHYVGDIHQPLHATSRVDHKYNSGDRGGNSFPLPVKDSVKNLHALWDSVLYEFTGYETLVSQFYNFYRRDVFQKNYFVYLKTFKF